MRRKYFELTPQSFFGKYISDLRDRQKAGPFLCFLAFPAQPGRCPASPVHAGKGSYMVRRKASGPSSDFSLLACSVPDIRDPRSIPDAGARPIHVPGCAGVDEAGRGCLAGPVVAAAVLLPEDAGTNPRLIEALAGLTDSKKLSSAKREELAPRIREHALIWGLGLSWPPEIDRINILQATFLAMSRALRGFCDVSGIRAVLIDGNHGIPDCRLPVGLPPQHPVIKGDSRVLAIAAASVLAKTFRDKLMTALDRRYPGYNFAAHKGYGTKEHRDALLRLGASPMHRHTFAGAHGPRNESDSHETQGRLC